MKTNSLCFIAIIAVLIFAAAAAAQNQPPKAPVNNVTDEYFGTKIVDPYRWMENLKSAEMQQWMRGQADYTNNYLKNLPLRAEIFQRLSELDAAGVVVRNVRRRGERYFYLKQAPGENNPKLFVRDGLGGAERLLVDADKYAVSGGQSSISAFSPSPDGRFVSFLIALGGGEYGTIRVLDVAGGKETGDVIEKTNRHSE